MEISLGIVNGSPQTYSIEPFCPNPEKKELSNLFEWVTKTATLEDDLDLHSLLNDVEKLSPPLNVKMKSPLLL